MFRCILLKKLLKNIKTRYLGSKHERTSSSLHEYLDTPSPSKGLWRSWFPILVVVPLAYYVIVAGDITRFTEHSLMKISDSVQEQESFMSLPVHYNSAVFLLHKDTANESLLKLRIDANKSFLARSQDNNKNNLLFSFDKRQGSKRFHPFCQTRRFVPNPREYDKIKKNYPAKTYNQYVFEHYSLNTVIEYRNQLSKGGYFESPLCRARHRVAVIVPYRDRKINLAVFLYVMHPFLIEQGLEYRIFIIEQSGKELFNRGRLLNVGFLEAQKHGKWGCMVFHDVDLLPTTDKIKYTCPTWPRHMCGSIIGRPETDKYKSHYGGVTMMTPSHYEKVNGYSNCFWGWGGEDTDMFWRIKNSGLSLTRYSKTVAVYKALPHKKGPENPVRKKLLKDTKARSKTDGLANCRYNIISKNMYQTYTHILVDINPDKENITEFQMQWQ